MQNQLELLFQLYQGFLKYPLENFSLFARMRPPSIEETKEDIKMGLGGDCTALSTHIHEILQTKEFNSRIVYFDNNLPEIDRTITISKEIDKKYHNAVVVLIKDINYLLDVGLQFEEPLPIISEQSFVFPTKRINIFRTGKNSYEISRVDRGTKKISLSLDLDINWCEEDHKRAAWNNFFRDIPLKYGILKKGKKVGLRLNGNEGIIIGKTKEDVQTLHLGGLESCAEYLGEEPTIFRRGYENFVRMRKEQGIL